MKSVDGRAEATTLQDESVDIVVAGQAFHWFDRTAARREFSRILKPGGRMLIIWNDREIEATPFMKAYEAFLQQFGTDYRYGLGQTHPGDPNGGETADWGLNATWITGDHITFSGSNAAIAAGGVWAQQGADWTSGVDFYTFGTMYTNGDFNFGGQGFYWAYQIAFDGLPTGACPPATP